VPRLLQVFSIPDLGLLEEPLFYVAGFPVRVRLALLSLIGVFAALQAPLPLEARAAIAAAGAVLGALPLKPPLGKLLARRIPPPREVYLVEPGLPVTIYVEPMEEGEVVVEVDGVEVLRRGASGGLVRLDVSFEPGAHVVRVVQAGSVLRKLRVVAGTPGGEAEGGAGKEDLPGARRPVRRFAGGGEGQGSGEVE